MNSLKQLCMLLTCLLFLCPQPGFAEEDDAKAVKYGEAALAYSAGSIQKSTPRDGIVNLITGDNQTTGNRMLLGTRDMYYLKLHHPADVAVGDLYTVYRRVRKVFHPLTKEYLGFVTIRLAVVRVVDVDRALATVEAIRAYDSVSPGDPVMRYVPPAEETRRSDGGVSDVAGLIVELQANKTMTIVSQFDVVYLDRGREDGLKSGDMMDVYRHSPGLPSRKIGQLKVLSTEDHTATAKVMKANARIMQGDRYKFAGPSVPLSQPVDRPASRVTPVEPVAPLASDAVASQLQVKDFRGQSRVSLGELSGALLYESGEAVMKSDSYRVLDQLIDYLRTSGDERLIRVEGHADNVEIGPSLRSRYASNLELSRARASGVIRYLVEKGGVDSARLTPVGYGDSRPTAPNVNEEGRSKNRRVEILLYAPEKVPPPSAAGSADAPPEGPAASNPSPQGSGEQTGDRSMGLVEIDAGAGSVDSAESSGHPGVSVPDGSDADRTQALDVSSALQESPVPVASPTE